MGGSTRLRLCLCGFMDRDTELIGATKATRRAHVPPPVPRGRHRVTGSGMASDSVGCTLGLHDCAEAGPRHSKSCALVSLEKCS